METMRSKLIIEYNGVDATDVIADDCDSFTWKDNASGMSDGLSLTLSNIDQRWMNGFYPSDKDSFKAWIQCQEWPADYRQGKIYCGCFMVDSLKYGGFPETLQLEGISVPINSDFNVKQKSRAWSKTTLLTMLGDIAKNAGIGLIADAGDVSIESANQTGKTDLAFAMSICSEYGLALKLYNNKMVVYDQAAYERREAKYDIKPTQLGEGGAYSIIHQVTNLYDSVKIQYTDGKKGSTLTYEYTIPGKAGNRQMIVTAKAESYADAEKKAKAALRENVRGSRKVTLKLMGSAKYMASDCFNLSGFGKLDGKYFIDSVTHQKSGGKYTVSITAHLAVTDF